jgi:glycosyltransferase 2 family protein
MAPPRGRGAGYRTHGRRPRRSARWRGVLSTMTLPTPDPAPPDAEPPDAEPPGTGPATGAPGRAARGVVGWAVVGATLLVSSWLLLGEPRSEVPDAERRVFEAVNGLPGAVEWLARPVMQLGTMAVALLIALLAGRRTGRRQVTVATVGAVLLGWAAARVVKDAVGRGRPIDVLDAVTLHERGVDGRGYVSGHTAVAFALATALTPLLPRRWCWVPGALAIGVGLARIYIGVHLPLDVVGGAGLGILCGLAGLVAAGVVPLRRRPAPARPGRPGR